MSAINMPSNTIIGLRLAAEGFDNGAAVTEENVSAAIAVAAPEVAAEAEARGVETEISGIVQAFGSLAETLDSQLRAAGLSEATIDSISTAVMRKVNKVGEAIATAAAAMAKQQQH